MGIGKHRMRYIYVKHPKALDASTFVHHLCVCIIYNTRFCRDLQIPRYNLEYVTKGFSHLALKVCNEIPISIRELPKDAFLKCGQCWF